MSDRRRRVSTRDRGPRVFLRSERRASPDLGKLSRALIVLALAQAKAEADAQAAHEKMTNDEKGDGARAV